MASIVNNKFWKEFITMYRESPELWDIKSEKYKHRIDKLKSWEKLVEKMKEVEPCANVDFVKKKINAMRSCYRREYRKVRRTEKCGGPVHVPTLWYYEDLDFLKDQKIETEEEIFNTDFDDGDEYAFDDEDMTQHFYKRKRSDSLDQNQDYSRKFIEYSGEKRIEGGRDEADIFAECWALMYRKLTPEQKLYAKRAIDEILIEGQLGKLHINSFQCNTGQTISGTYSVPAPISVQLPNHPLKFWNDEPNCLQSQQASSSPS